MVIQVCGHRSNLDTPAATVQRKRLGDLIDATSGHLRRSKHLQRAEF
jgi:hypothetical protein